MVTTNYELFCDDLDEYADFDKLTGILNELDLSTTVYEIDRHRKFTGRQDWPIEAMLRSLIAMKVFQYKSTSGFLRELARNPSLMILSGFDLKRNKVVSLDELKHDPVRQNYRIPSDSAMSRFQQTLVEVDKNTGCLKDLFKAQLEKIQAQLPEFGQRIGYDGKAIESHSTGRQLKHKEKDKKTGKHPTSDPTASWGVHEQYVTGPNGKEKKIKNRWYGFELHLLADVNYELPISFSLAPAHESEVPHCRKLVSTFLDESDIAERTLSFVADRGLDDNLLRKTVYEKGILPVIDNRNLWRDDNPHPDQLELPTRALYDDADETILYNEHGQHFCRCPKSGEIRPMYYQGREAVRGTVKWICPASAYGITCQGRQACYKAAGLEADASTRVVRDKIDMDHLRNHGPLPLGTYKWKRIYNQRSAIERINSRIDANFQTHDHFIRGIHAMRMHLSLGFTVMLAGACMAIKAGRPEKMRCLATSLAA
ncbi:MAG: transposase [Candidatus Poribacteria bacterium]|nr:transposase [Candidatus Poribacteria bacterium]